MGQLVGLNHNSTAFQELKTNVGKLASLCPANCRLKEPTTNALTKLHDYAMASKEDAPELKKDFLYSLNNVGNVLANTVRRIFVANQEAFESLISKSKKISSRICRLAGIKESDDSEFLKDKTVGKSADELFKLIRSSEENNGKILKHIAKNAKPTIEIRLQRKSRGRDVSLNIESPLKLFRYLELATKRNLIAGRKADTDIKAFAYLGHSIVETATSQGEFTANYKELRESFGYTQDDLEAVVKKWNEGLISQTEKFKPVFDSRLSEEDISQIVSKLSDIDQSPLSEINKAIEYINDAKEMEYIYSNSKNTRTSMLEKVVEWFIYLKDHDAVSLSNYLRSKGADSETQIKVAARTLKDWNKKF